MLRQAYNRMKHGFTLIELLIGLAILSLLLMLALPAFSTMLNNQRLRAAAESILNGLQTARTEAVKLNAQVQFVTTDDDASIAAQVSTLTPSATGQNWAVRAFNPTTALWDVYVEGKKGSSASGGTASAVTVTGTDSTITFSGLGTTTLLTTSTYQLQNPTGGLCAPAGPMRCLNVTVSRGGTIRMCDPSVTAVGDTRKC